MQEDRQVLGLVNPVLDSDYEDDDTLETERRFSGIFNTFGNRWRVRKMKMGGRILFLQ